MKMTLAILTLLSTSAWANLHLAPPDFVSKSGRSVFVDFKTAQYDVTYDLENKITTVRSTIVFEAEKTGKPIFDLVPNPKNVTLDGVATRVVALDFPDKISKARLVDTFVDPGEHVLKMENTFKANVRYHDNNTFNVSSAFWIRDLKERMFLEQYVPSNLEFDQYQMTINAKFVGVKKIDQEFFTNGVVTKNSPTSWTIVYPDYFTASSLYYHTTRQGSLRRMDYNYLSVNGREIPVTVYTPWYLATSDFKKYSEEIFAELEADYGPWGHPSFVAYGTLPGTGGMEHSGATQTSLGAFDHEMLHSYFAKGVMPSNGNSGWIDEAIASWRDRGYLRLPTVSFGGSDIGGQSVYKRNTDDRSYALGAAFMAYLDYRLQNIGGLKAFLRGYFAAYNHMVITEQHFKNNLEFFSGMDLTHEFDTYIWGTNTPDAEGLSKQSHHHAPMTEAQLKSIL